MTTIIFAHPWHRSFNKAILDTVIEALSEEYTEYQIIDLHKDNFNPVLSEEELIIFNEGKYIDPLVKKYQDMILMSNDLIFIFPDWWSSMPAILKGFFDKVFLKGFAYDDSNNSWKPLLKIPKSMVITTSGQPTENISKFGDVYNDMIFNILTSVGIENTLWMNCGLVSIPGTDRKVFLEKVNQCVKTR
ncbi:MAG: NAD(P)H-dependent oxidoreductase [Bacteroidales bacterium]|jgi:putative NADPH-quinone reductase|nr:NAD(P)H-dependent oxidoreductase [Bacteroidales bacterium]